MNRVEINSQDYFEKSKTCCFEIAIETRLLSHLEEKEKIALGGKFDFNFSATFLISRTSCLIKMQKWWVKSSKNGDLRNMHILFLFSTHNLRYLHACAFSMKNKKISLRKNQRNGFVDCYLSVSLIFWNNSNLCDLVAKDSSSFRLILKTENKRIVFDKFIYLFMLNSHRASSRVSIFQYRTQCLFFRFSNGYLSFVYFFTFTLNPLLVKL